VGPPQSAVFVATGDLAYGQWKLRIGYGAPAIDGPAPSSPETVHVP
jgi:hypothetical protein